MQETPPSNPLATAGLYVMFVAVYVAIGALLGLLFGVPFSQTVDDVLRACLIGGSIGAVLGIVASFAGRAMPEVPKPAGKASPSDQAAPEHDPALNKAPDRQE